MELRRHDILALAGIIQGYGMDDNERLLIANRVADAFGLPPHQLAALNRLATDSPTLAVATGLTPFGHAKTRHLDPAKLEKAGVHL